MKSDVRARPDGDTQRSPNGEQPAKSKQPFRRAVLVAVAIVALVAGGAFAARQAIVGVLLTRGLSLATGDRIEIGAYRLGRAGGQLDDVRVTTGRGDPLFAAARIDVRYSLPALLSKRGPRWGLEAVTLERPVFAIVRSADGRYNIGRQAAQNGGPSRAGRAAAPWIFTAHIRNGEIRLIDRAPSAGDLAQQRIERIELDANVRSDERSVITGSAAFDSRRNLRTPLTSWPIELRALLDYPRGLAIARIAARQLPLRGPIGFLQHSAAVRVDDGLLDGVVMRLYAFAIDPNEPLDLHIGGSGMLHDGRLTIAALRRPVRGLSGRITLVDDGVWSTRLTGDLAGIALDARGGAFDRLAPVIRIGVHGDGDLHDLRLAFGFAQRQPLRGAAHVETLLEAPASGMLIRTALRVRRGAYARVPITDVSGRVDYHAGAVVLDGIRGRYGSAALNVGGRFLLGNAFLDSAIVAAATAPGRAVPYSENLAPDANVDLLALITGGPAGFRARGALGTSGGETAGDGIFAIDERGVGEFGPFILRRPDGSSVIGALELDRPASLSAAWVSAHGYRVAIPGVPARLAGLNVAAFPPVAGVIDGAIAGGGSPGRFGVTGSLRGDDLRVGAAHLGRGRVVLGGTLADVRLGGLRLTGPAGSFDGSAAAAGGVFALRGAYDGSLQALEPFTGKQNATGAVRGNVLARVAGADVVVQSPRAVLHGGKVRGVAVDSAAGTVAIRNKQFHLLAATGSIAGARAVAAEWNGAIALSAPNLPSRALRGTGLPLDAGLVSAYGVADLRGTLPRFDGNVAVADGRADGYSVAGDAQIDLAGARAVVRQGAGELGSTYGTVSGAIDGIGAGPIGYALDTRVPVGDIETLRQDLALPIRHLAGSFAARFAVRGAGTRPWVTGRVDVPEGVFNGLAFRDGAAAVDVRAGRLAARSGTLTVGSTTAAFAAEAGGGRYALSAQAPHADLADFDDFFDTSGTIGGQGAVDLVLRSDGSRLDTSGSIDLRDTHFRAFVLGDAALDWHMRGRTIAGRVRVTSPAATLRVDAAIEPGAGTPRQALAAARYEADATFGRVDVGRWLAAAGSSLPVTGTADARLHVAGRLPNVTTRFSAALSDANVAGFAVSNAHIRATSAGSRIAVAESDADLGFARLAGEGVLGLADADPLAFDLRVTTPDIGPAVGRFFPAAERRNAAGTLDADIRLTGSRASPALAGGFELGQARYAGLVVPRAIGEVALTGKRLELRDAELELTHGSALLAGSLPLIARPFGIGPPSAPLSLEITARNVDLSEFMPLLPAGTVLGGTVDGRIGIEGTVDRPELAGSLTVADGSYTGPIERAPITHVGAQVDFGGTSIALRSFHAGLGRGTLDADGEVQLPTAARRSTRYSAHLAANAATFDLPAYGRGTLDGDLTLTGSGRTPVVAGEVSLRDAVIPVSAVYGAGAASAAAAGGGAFPIDPRLSFTASAGDNVRVRSGIVDIGVAGGVNVSGTLAAPRLSGGFTATDGTISSYNHVFRIVNAAVTFNPADGTVPTIEARAVARVPNPDPDPSRNISGAANIYVTVSGTADDNNLQVTYSSDPAYSQEQIVGLLLDVPALLGAVNFNLNGGPGSPLLRGAPGETNVLLPPGITPEQVSAVSFNEEVFSLLNGQFTQRALSPLERLFQKSLGLSDIAFTVDYGGGIGYSVRRHLGKRDFYAFLSQTVTYPERANVGFELVPKAFESVNFSIYAQNGVTSLITNQTPGEEFFGSDRRLTSVQPLGNRAGVSLNLNRRF